MTDDAAKRAPSSEAALVDLLRDAIARSSGNEVSSADRDELRRVLERWFDELGLRSPLRRNLGRGSSSSVGFWDEAQWLLDASLLETPETAVARLRQFINKNESEYQQVILFWGMHPPSMIELAEGLQLGPLDALPDSAPRRYFLGESLTEADRRTTEYQARLKPRAVIVQRIPPIPVYEDVHAVSQPFSWDDKYFLSELIQLLSVVIRSPVIRVSEWLEWPQDQPIVSRGGGWGWSSHTRATSEIPKSSYDIALTKRLIGSYLELSPIDRNRLRLPLRRLNAALLSESVADRAIELGIATEALLSQPNDPTDGIGHRVAVRAGLLVDSGLEGRRDGFRRAKDLYRLRSIAAHGGDLDEVNRERAPWGVSGKFKRPEEIFAVLEDAPNLICSVVMAILGRGGFPDYFDLELGQP